MNRKIMIVDENKVVNFAGGIEKVICAFANEFSRRGDQVSIVCLDVEQGKPLFELNEKVQFINLAFDLGEKFYGLKWQILKVVKELIRAVAGRKMRLFGCNITDPKRKYYEKEFIERVHSYIEDLCPDIILTISPDSAYFVQQALCNKKTPIIAMCHTDPVNSGEIKTKRQIDAWENCYAVQVLLPPFVSMLKDMGIKKVIEIPNFVEQIDENEVCDLSITHKTIIAVGRLEEDQKRQHLLVEAFAKIAPRYPDWHIELYGSVGNRHYKKKIEALIRERKVAKQVLLKGVSENIGSCLKKADMIAFTSKYEGFSIALTEAMSMGLPVVAFKECLSIASLVESEKNGILCESGIDNLAEALERLIENKIKRIEYGKNAHESMKKYSPETIWDKWDGHIDDCLKN